MTSFIFFEKLESAFGPAVPNTPSDAVRPLSSYSITKYHVEIDFLEFCQNTSCPLLPPQSRERGQKRLAAVSAKPDESDSKILKELQRPIMQRRINNAAPRT
jgi:hypothetical protein